jgi:hypothetical protein
MSYLNEDNETITEWGILACFNYFIFESSQRISIKIDIADMN